MRYCLVDEVTGAVDDTEGSSLMSNPYLLVWVRLWLGHKYVSKSNFLIKWWYDGSVNRDFFIENSNKCIDLSLHNTKGLLDSIFLDDKRIVLTALIEMKIFERVLTELLEKAKTLPFAQRKEIVEMISRQEIIKFISEQDDFRAERILTWDPQKEDCIPKVDESMGPNSGILKISVKEHYLDLISEFCETVSEKFLTGNTVRLVQRVKGSNWFNFKKNLEDFDTEIILYSETPGQKFLEGHLEDVKKKCFERLLAEPNLPAHASQTVADFLQSNISERDFAKFLVTLWNKSHQRKSLIDICIIFSNKKKVVLGWYAEPFLSDKIGLGDCDKFLLVENLSSSEVFGPVVAMRVLKLAQEKFGVVKQDFE